MVTKAQIADLIRDLKSGGIPNADNTKFDERDIFKMTDIAYSSLIAITHQQGETNFGSYITAYPDIKVEKDDVRNEFFSNLPAKLLTLPNDEGLRKVQPIQDRGVSIIITNNGNEEIYSGLHAGGLGGRSACYLEGDKIFYINLSSHITSVLIKQISSIEALDKDKAIPIPADKEQQLFDMIVERLTEQKRTTEDTYNNANSNLTTR